MDAEQAIYLMDVDLERAALATALANGHLPPGGGQRVEAAAQIVYDFLDRIAQENVQRRYQRQAKGAENE